MKFRLLAALCVSFLAVILFSMTPLKASADIVFPGGSQEDPYERCFNALGCPQTEDKNKYQQLTLPIYFVNAAIEVFIAAILLLLLKKLSARSLLAVGIVNLISLPLLYALLHYYPTTLAYSLGEVGVWLFEAIGIYYLSKKNLNLLSSFLISALTNATTIGVSLLYWLK
jgi:hypothetical protein